MTRKRVYVAGPISKGDLAENVRRATRAALALMRAGYAPLCPHWSCYAGGPLVSPSGTVYAVAEPLPAGTSHGDWMGVDLPWVVVADAVLRLPGESAGADAEVREADRLGVPVFHGLDELDRYFRPVPEGCRCGDNEPVPCA